MIADAFEYLKQTQRFLREQKQEFENPDDLLVYINRARREVAGRTQCIRRLTPISGQVVSATVTAGGSGYVNPVATITTPDWASGTLPSPNGRQATAGVEMNGGVVTGVNINDGGDGYFQPQVTITDASGPGTGATATLTVSPINTLNLGQEVYNFRDIYRRQLAGRGYGSCGQSRSGDICAISLHRCRCRHFRPIRRRSGSIRSHVSVCALLWLAIRPGHGRQFLFLPAPSQMYQLEFDCFCLPTDMTAGQLDSRSDPAAVDRRGAVHGCATRLSWSCKIRMPPNFTRRNLTR